MSAQTYRDRVAEFFRAHPGEWIDGEAFRPIGGKYAYRTRISECRTELGMDIENRKRRVEANTDGGYFVVSEYRYVPPVEREREPIADLNAWSLR